MHACMTRKARQIVPVLTTPPPNNKLPPRSSICHIADEHAGTTPIISWCANSNCKAGLIECRIHWSSICACVYWKKLKLRLACLAYTFTLKVTELPNIRLQSARALLLHIYNVHYNSITHKRYKANHKGHDPRYELKPPTTTSITTYKSLPQTGGEPK